MNINNTFPYCGGKAKTNLFHDIAIAFHEWNLGHIYKNGFIRDLES